MITPLSPKDVLGEWDGLWVGVATVMVAAAFTRTSVSQSDTRFTTPVEVFHDSLLSLSSQPQP